MKTRYKNITRYTYEFQDFLGYRLCLTRNHNILTKYFSDKHYGSPEKALAAALALRDEVLQKLAEGAAPAELFAEYR